jgi:hypothetical protein
VPYQPRVPQLPPHEDVPGERGVQALPGEVHGVALGHGPTVARQYRCGDGEGGDMARVLPLLSVLAFLCLGVGLADDQSVLVGVVGAALWMLGRARHAVAHVRTGLGFALVVPGRTPRRTVGAPVRQRDPDAAGRRRARAPGRVLPAV